MAATDLVYIVVENSAEIGTVIGIRVVVEHDRYGGQNLYGDTLGVTVIDPRLGLETIRFNLSEKLLALVHLSGAPTVLNPNPVARAITFFQVGQVCGENVCMNVDARQSAERKFWARHNQESDEVAQYIN